MEIQKYKRYLIDYLKDALKDTKTDGFVVGISGGVDSSVAAAFAKLSTDNNYLCISLPCESSAIDYACINELVYKFHLKFLLIDISDIYLNIVKTIEKKIESKLNYLIKGNIKSRLRMLTLYIFSNLNNYLVMGTTNMCEKKLGYFTKFGDGAADIYPLINMTKNNIYEFAKLFKIPNSIIEREPSASLFSGQTDEKDLNLKYKDIDKYLEDDTSVSKKIKDLIENLSKKNKHKNINYPLPKSSIK